MDYTIYGGTLAPAEQKKDGTSVNIKENTSPAGRTGGVDFTDVFVSGTSVDMQKMDENTYKSLLKETDDVKSQIMASATNAKANLKALFNRLSGADIVKINEEGFNLNDMTQEEMVNIVDRIKIELAAHSDSYAATVTGISVEQIEQVVGNAGYANAIASKMQEAGIPATEDNVKEIAAALQHVSGIKHLSENAKCYMVQKHMEPTIENIYKAEHATLQSKGVRLRPDQWDQLKPQVTKMLRQAKLEPSQTTYSMAKGLIDIGIPATAENLAYKAKLDKLELSGDVVIDHIVGNLASGGEALATVITDEKNVVQQVVEALKAVEEVNYDEVALATHRAEVNEEPVTLGGIQEARQLLNADAMYGGMPGGVVMLTGEEMAAYQRAMAQPAFVSKADMNYRTMLQVQILMTAASSVFLARQGTSLMTVPISTLEARLEEYDRMVLGYGRRPAPGMIGQQLAAVSRGGYYGNDPYAGYGIGISPNGAQGVYQLTQQVRRAMYDIKYAPDVTIGAMLDKNRGNEPVTIGDFAQMGNSLKQRFKQAGETYAAVGTMVRDDLGDSIDKALDSSTGELLDSLKLEPTRANVDAVRILGYNSMEMTADNVNRVKELHAALNSLISHMTPDKVLDMIRNNINPMMADIRDVDKYLQGQARPEDQQEKYSTFLYKLDRTEGITKEERRQFIGIYKMMNMFTQDAGNAIGALMKQNAEITMANLCMAYDSRKAQGLDKIVDDFSKEEAGAAAYYTKLFEKTASSITPLTLKNVQEDQAIGERSVENFCETAQEMYDAQEEAQYYEAYLEQVRKAADADSRITQELRHAGEPVTLYNLRAMEHLMQNGAFDILFGGSKARAQRFFDRIGQRDELEAEYKVLKKNADKELDALLEGHIPQEDDEPKEEFTLDEDINYEELESIRMRNRQIGLITNLSMRHDYSVPLVTEKGISMLRLTLFSDTDDKGSISIHFEDEDLGTVSVEARVRKTEIGLYGVCKGDDRQLWQRLAQVAEYLKADYGVQKVSVFSSRSDLVNRITYAAAADSTPNDVLYKMSKTIICGLVRTANAG